MISCFLMTRKRSLLLLEILFVLLAVSGLAGLYLLVDGFMPPHIVHHKKPNLSVDVSPFVTSDCADEYGGYACAPLPAAQSLGCSSLLPQPLFGGLTPQYPIIVCRMGRPGLPPWEDPIPGECIYTNGGLGISCYQYIIYKDNRFQRVDTMETFRGFFAPVDSPEEALGFALASGDYEAKYGQRKNHRLVYSVGEFEDTYVKAVPDGYIVQLFYTPLFGCPPFVTEAVEINVTYDGSITVMDRFPLYHDEASKFCID
jgi:hypothetical protein